MTKPTAGTARAGTNTAAAAVAAPATAHPSAKALIDAIARGADPSVRRSLEQLAASPEARAALERVDGENQQRRIDLRRQIDSHDARWAPEVRQRTTARLKAEARLQAALNELKAARDEASAATGAAAGLAVHVSRELARLEAELIATADPRLAELDQHMVALDEAARHLASSVDWIAGNDLFGRPIHRHDSNLPEVRAARDELTAVRAAVAAHQREPLTRSEVTGVLADLVLRVAAAVAPFDLPAVRLNEADGSLVFEHPRSTSIARKVIIDPAPAGDDANELA